MMSIRDAWSALRSNDSPASNKAFRMRLVDAVGDLRIFAVIVEETRGLGLAFEIPESVRPARLVSYSGRRVAVDLFTGPEIGEERVAVLVSLKDKTSEDLFSHLCDHLLSRVAANPNAKTAIDAIADEIDRWRRFMEKHRRPLDNQAVIGLIGELAVLERLMHRVGNEHALASWRSPDGSLRDFELADRTVEVKAYTASAGGLVHIHDPMQLEPDSGRRLFLACQEVVQAEAGGSRLPDHVARVRSHLSADATLVGDFDRLLAGSGYLPMHQMEYREHYGLGELKVFEVGTSFPRVKPASVPLGVTHVHFGLTVASLTDFQADASIEIGTPEGVVGEIA
jgi:hypothetical protein